MANCMSCLFRTSGLLLSASVIVYNLKSGPSWWSETARKRMRVVLGLFLSSNFLSLFTAHFLNVSNPGLIICFRGHPYVTTCGIAICVLYCKVKLRRLRECNQLSVQEINIAWLSYSVLTGIPFSLFETHVILRVLPTYVLSVGISLLVTNIVPSSDYETFSVGWILALLAVAVSTVSGMAHLCSPQIVGPVIVQQSLAVTFFGVLLDEFQFATKKITDAERIPEHRFNPAYVSFPLFAVGSILLYRLAALHNSHCTKVAMI